MYSAMSCASLFKDQSTFGMFKLTVFCFTSTLSGYKALSMQMMTQDIGLC